MMSQPAHCRQAQGPTDPPPQIQPERVSVSHRLSLLQDHSGVLPGASQYIPAV